MSHGGSGHNVFAKEGTWHPVHRAGQRDGGLAQCFDGHLGSLVVASEPCSLLSTYYVSGSVVSTLQCEPTQPSRPPSRCMQSLLAPFYRREHGLSWRGRSTALGVHSCSLLSSPAQEDCEFLGTGTLARSPESPLQCQHEVITSNLSSER